MAAFSRSPPHPPAKNRTAVGALCAEPRTPSGLRHDLCQGLNRGRAASPASAGIGPGEPSDPRSARLSAAALKSSSRDTHGQAGPRDRALCADEVGIVAFAQVTALAGQRHGRGRREGNSMRLEFDRETFQVDAFQEPRTIVAGALPFADVDVQAGGAAPMRKAAPFRPRETLKVGGNLHGRCEIPSVRTGSTEKYFVITTR